MSMMPLASDTSPPSVWRTAGTGDVFIMRTDDILAIAPLATDSMDLEKTVNDSWGSDKTVDKMVVEEKTKIMIPGEATSTTLPSI